jgi:hypothetical protein
VYYARRKEDPKIKIKIPAGCVAAMFEEMIGWPYASPGTPIEIRGRMRL